MTSVSHYVHSAYAFRGLILSLIATCLLAVRHDPTLAAVKTWTGNSNSDWSVGNNWSPSGAAGNGDSVVFPTAGINRTVNLSGNRSVVDLTFNSTNAYRLFNNQLTLTSGDLTSLLGGNHRIDSNVVIADVAAWNIASGSVQIYGAINTVTPTTFGIDKTGAGTLEFLNEGTTNSIKNFLHQAGTTEFYEGTYSLTSQSFDAYAAMYMGGGTVIVSHRANIVGTPGGNLVLQSGGAGGSNLVIKDDDTEVATFGQVLLGASGTAGNSITVEREARMRDIGVFINGFNGNSSVMVRNGGTVETNAMAVGMLTGVTSTLSIQDQTSALTTSHLALGGFNSAQKGGTGTVMVTDRGSLVVSGELRFFSSTSSLTVNNATATIGILKNEAGVTGSIKLRNFGSTAALTINSPAESVATWDGIIANDDSSGGILKQGSGEQVFTNQQTYTGGTRIEAGTLTLGTANTLAPTGAITAVGGELNLGGLPQQVGAVNLEGGAIRGAVTSTLLPASLALQSGTIAVPTIAAGAVSKTSAGTATFDASLTASSITVSAGTLTANGALSAPSIAVTGGILAINQGATATTTTVNGGTLQLRGPVIGNLQSASGGALTITGLTTLSGTTSLSGSINLGSHTFVSTSTEAMSVASLSISGGTIVSPAGIHLNGGVVGRGMMLAPISGTSGTAITAVGGILSLGSPNAEDGFTDFDGLILINDNQVNLLSAQTAELGSSTSIAGGSLNSLNGIQLGGSETLAGHGTVQGTFINQGEVTGGNGADILTFTGAVTGAGSFAGNVQFDSSYSPGNSPAAVTLENVDFGDLARLTIELGGTTEGSQFDHLDVSGLLSLDGVLDIELINEFSPTAGMSFDILDWNTFSGTFDSIQLPELDGLYWDLSDFYQTGTLSVVEPFAADFNLDGNVDGDDLAIWQAGYNLGTTHLQGDADGDNDVDGRDFMAWQRQFGSSLNPAPLVALVSVVPEPGTSLLLLVASASLAFQRSHRLRFNEN